VAVIGSHRRSAFAIYDHVGNFHRLPDAQFHLQEVELHYTIGRHMRHPFLAHSFEVEDVVRMVRLNFAQRAKLYDGPARLSPGITLHPVCGHTGIARPCAEPASHHPRPRPAGHAAIRGAAAGIRRGGLPQRNAERLGEPPGCNFPPAALDPWPSGRYVPIV
jgi:hypothetical protein